MSHQVATWWDGRKWRVESTNWTSYGKLHLTVGLLRIGTVELLYSSEAIVTQRTQVAPVYMKYLTESKEGLFVPSLISSEWYIVYLIMGFILWLEVNLRQIVLSCFQRDIQNNICLDSNLITFQRVHVATQCSRHGTRPVLLRRSRWRKDNSSWICGRNNSPRVKQRAPRCNYSMGRDIT